jgi:hypothetical protein
MSVEELRVRDGRSRVGGSIFSVRRTVLCSCTLACAILAYIIADTSSTLAGLKMLNGVSLQENERPARAAILDTTSHATRGRRLRSTPETTDEANSVTLKNDHSAPSEKSITLDYFIAGFAKCGTTTLLDAFREHKETVMPEAETNIMTTPGSDDDIYERMMNELEPLAPETARVKRGIKCPQGLETLHSIQRLQRLFPRTKLIFGLRHPVWYFQSFYNFRVLSHYQNGLTEPIPSVESLLNESWASLSVESARFENTLKNLGKTNISLTTDVTPTPFKVFLYTIEQMQDRNETRKKEYRDALRRFLGLKDPISPLPHSNRQDEVFDETIDVCDSKYDKVRNVLVKNGKESQRWILEEFLESPDVTVANPKHFRELLQTFGSDPCLKSVE